MDSFVDESKASDEGQDESEKELYMPRAPWANEKGPRFVTNLCQLDGWNSIETTVITVAVPYIEWCRILFISSMPRR